MENSAELNANGKFLGTITSDFVKVSEKLKEANYQIRSKGFSDYPIFVFCKAEQPIGQLLISKQDAEIEWNIYASLDMEFIQRELITKPEEFVQTYKNPDEFCCLFVVDPEFTNFVFLPYPED